MNDASVYYCWSCDAHCKAQRAGQKEVRCPRCGKLLADEDRLRAPARSLVLPLPKPAAPRELLSSPA